MFCKSSVNRECGLEASFDILIHFAITAKLHIAREDLIKPALFIFRNNSAIAHCQ